MIPKVIHYCWFGGNPLPDLALKCIASWKKYFQGWEIKQWDESNFDVNCIPYIADAHKAKKYAFVSDYARFWILYNEGGLYFDTDVEIITPMNDIVDAGPFMGCEKPYKTGGSPNDLGVNPGLGLGATPGLKLYKEILDFYSTLDFINNDGSINKETVVTYTTDILCKHGLTNTANIQVIDDIRIYPKDYFCPIDYDSQVIVFTPNTHSIHHYTSSWMDKQDKRTIEIKRSLKFMPERIGWKFARLFATLGF